MGNNYYLHRDVCSLCKRGSDILHIGKSSYGWLFSLHVEDPNPVDPTPSTLEEWIKLLSDPQNVIKDEYDIEVSLEEFLKIIKDRKSIPDPKPSFTTSNKDYDTLLFEEKFAYIRKNGYKTELGYTYTPVKGKFS